MFGGFFWTGVVIGIGSLLMMWLDKGVKESKTEKRVFTFLSLIGFATIAASVIFNMS